MQAAEEALRLEQVLGLGVVLQLPGQLDRDLGSLIFQAVRVGRVAGTIILGNVRGNFSENMAAAPLT